jgi:hypothetical protein
MATNLNIDEKLLEQALRLGGNKTKRATVNQALYEYVQRRRQKEIIQIFGHVDFDPNYDYKSLRKAR